MNALRRLRDWLDFRDRIVSGTDPTCPIGWKPSLFKPVFYGYTDTTATFPPEAIARAPTSATAVKPASADESPYTTERATAAPGQVSSAAAASPEAFATPLFGIQHPLRIFYPSLDGAPQDAPMLTGCGRYPLVIFLHGECFQDSDHYKKWFELPATLARSGYVVLVPRLSGAPPGGSAADLEMVRRLVSWARSEWSGHESLMPTPATALIGHSHGGGNTTVVVNTWPHLFSAYVSLSGVVLSGGFSHIIPKLFMVGGDDEVEVLGVPISNGVERMTEPAHYVVFHGGGHWDYLPRGRSACEAGLQGPCNITHQVGADMVACFLTRYLRPEAVPDVKLGPFHLFRVHASLRPPTFWRMLLTNEQKFFAGGHLVAWGLAAGREGCGLTSEWKVPGQKGSLVRD